MLCALFWHIWVVFKFTALFCMYPFFPGHSSDAKQITTRRINRPRNLTGNKEYDSDLKQD